jgi:hypothetical protein
MGISGTVPTGAPPLTPRAKTVLELTLRETLQLGHEYMHVAAVRGTGERLVQLVRSPLASVIDTRIVLHGPVLENGIFAAAILA